MRLITVRDAKQAKKYHTNVPQEYVVSVIMRHGHTTQKRRYVVSCSGYCQEDDTLEPPPHELRHFIGQYWNRLKHEH